MAELLGVSVSNIKRAFVGTSIWFQNGKYKNRPELVAQVMGYYAKHGKPATVKRFPDVNVKSIIDRPEYYGLKKANRQIRWTDEQIIEAARMAGLVSPSAQAKYFNRPRAHAGSIKSLWMKKFKIGGGGVNGMVYWMAKDLVSPNAPYLKPVGESRNKQPVEFRKLLLWVDMHRHVRPEVPEFIKDAIRTMAEFQKWLHGTKDPRKKILKMINERETNQFTKE
jgi:hypothetical protein